MNIPIGLIDENGKVHKLVMDFELLSELTKSLRTEGVTDVHTMGDDGQLKTYHAHSVFISAKGTPNRFLLIPLETEMAE